MRKEHYVMDAKLKWLLVIGLLLVSLAMPVMAATGSFDSVGGLTSISFDAGAGGLYPYVHGIFLNQTQNETGLTAIISVTSSGGYSSIPSDTTNVNLYAGDTQIGTGTFGFDYSSVAGQYTVYLYITALNLGTLSGQKFINFTPLATSKVWNLSGLRLRQTSGASYVNGVYFQGSISGVSYSYMERYYNVYQSREFHNTYDVTYSVPISTIAVTKVINGLPYPSTVYIMEGTTVLGSNTTITSDPYLANIVGAPYFTINVTDMWGNWYISELICPTGICGAYNISVLPASITPTTSTLGGITSSVDPFLSGITGISWKWYDSTTGYHNFYDGGNTSRPLEYSLKSGTWYGYDSTLNTYSIAQSGIPNPVTLSGITSTGDKTIYCYVFTSDGNYYTLTAPLTVGGTGAGESGSVMIHAVDWRTYDDLTGAAINIKNLGTNTWSNETTAYGRRQYDSPVGTRFYIETSASGYTTANNPMYQMTAWNSLSIPMYPTGAGSTGIINSTLYVTTYDADTYNTKQGVTVKVVNDGQIAVTPWSGTTSFVVLNNTAYTISAGCSANQCIGQTKTETISGSAYQMKFYLSPYVVTTTPTLAPGITATVTATPTWSIKEGTNIRAATTQEGEALSAFAQISAALAGWFNVGIGIVSITLLWMVVYAMTGGKILDKMMRRGRGGR